MFHISNFILFLAFCLSCYSNIVFFPLKNSNDIRLYRSGARAVYVSTGFIILSLLSLFTAILRHDFSLKITAAYSQKGPTVFYNIASILVSERGFLLVWALLLSILSSIIIAKSVYTQKALSPYIIIIFGLFASFLLFLLNFAVNPFDKTASIPENGNGLHPSLHYPFAMLSHPLTLISGYIGLTYTFACSLEALFEKSPDNKWLYKTRFCTVLSWIFLIISALIGCHWAYLLEGWGGYWSWDVIENVSLLPLLFSTAYLHSVIIQEKRGMLKIWNVLLIMFTFNSILFATYVSRSKYFPTSHFFSHSSSADYFLLVFILSSVFSLVIILKRLDFLKSDNRLDSALSRESSFLFNNLLIVGIAFVIIWGIILPVFSPVIGKEINIGPLFFQEMIIPIGLLLLLLTGVCPLFAWKKTSGMNLKRNFIFPLAGALIGGGCIYLFSGIHEIRILTTCVFSIFVSVSIGYEFFIGAWTRKESNYLTALYKLVFKNRRKYGGYIIHLGIILIFLGASGSVYKMDKTINFKLGEYAYIGDYRIGYEKIEDYYTNIDTAFTLLLNLSIEKKSALKGILKPKMEFHRGWPSYARSAVYSSVLEDLYIRWSSYNKDDGSVILDVSINPFVRLIWTGGWVIVIGAIIALMPVTHARKFNGVSYI